MHTHINTDILFPNEAQKRITTTVPTDNVSLPYTYVHHAVGRVSRSMAFVVIAPVSD